MNKKTVFVSIWVALLVGSGIVAAGYFKPYTFSNDWFPDTPFQKGMSFTTWQEGSFNTTQAKSQLDEMKAAGVEWVAINMWWFQSDRWSHDIKYGIWSDSFDNMTSCFEYAHSIGLKVLYKPMLNLETYDWRSFINYTDIWMETFSNWTVLNAIAAEKGDVEIFSIGCEMGNMQVHSDAVRDMIKRIREVYSGQLTYSANHDSFWFVDWWDAVDIIGVDMYTPMTTKYDPTLQELINVWDSFYYRMESFAIKWDRPIFFPEMGAQARDGSNIVPNDNNLSNKQDVEELRDIYVSLFKSKLWTAPWFKGVYWWIWNLYPVGEDSQDFNPNLPLVLQAITEEYTKEHTYRPSMSFLYVIIIFALAIASFVIVLKKNMFDGNLLEEKDPVISISILFGMLLYLVFSNLSVLIYSGLYSTISKSILLGLSPLGVGLILSGLFAAVFLSLFLIHRFANESKPEILLMLLGTYPLLTWGIGVESVTIRSYFELLIVLLVMNLFIESFAKYNKTKEIRPVNTRFAMLTKCLTCSFAIAFAFVILGLIFDKLTQGLLVIPMLYLLLSKSSGSQAKSESETAAQSEQPTDIKESTNNDSKDIGQPGQMRFRRYSVINGLVFGLLCFFGSAFYNLVNFNDKIVMLYLVTPFAGASVLGLIVLLMIRSNEKNAEKVQKLLNKTADPMFLIGIAAVIALIGLFASWLDLVDYFWIVLGSVGLFVFVFHVALSFDLYSTSDNKGRSMFYLFIILIFFALGFVLIGIRGFVTMMFVMLEFAGGQIIIRESREPLDYNAVILTNILFALVPLLISLVFLLYGKLTKKFSKPRQ